jgi:hypothetical protein
MVQIQSTWFPLTDRNPQVFINIPDVKPSEFIKAAQHIYHAPSQASAIETNVLPTPTTKNSSNCSYPVTHPFRDEALLLRFFL